MRKLLIVLLLIATPLCAQQLKKPGIQSATGGGVSTTTIGDSLLSYKMKKDTIGAAGYITLERFRDSLAAAYARYARSIDLGTMARVDSTIYKDQFLKNADSTTIKNSARAQAQADMADSLADHEWVGSTRGTAADSMGLKSDIPVADFSFTLDSARTAAVGDTTGILLPRYAMYIDSIGIRVKAPAAVNFNVKFILSAANPQAAWSDLTDTVTVTLANATTWISGANISSATLTALRDISLILTSVTTAAREIRVIVACRRKDANGSTYGSTY